jgi:hypothetical protein
MKDTLLRELALYAEVAPGWELWDKVALCWCETCGEHRRPCYKVRCTRSILLPNLTGQVEPTHGWYLCARCIGRLEVLTACAVLGEMSY